MYARTHSDVTGMLCALRTQLRLFFFRFVWFFNETALFMGTFKRLLFLFFPYCVSKICAFCLGFVHFAVQCWMLRFHSLCSTQCSSCASLFQWSCLSRANRLNFMTREKKNTHRTGKIFLMMLVRSVRSGVCSKILRMRLKSLAHTFFFRLSQFFFSAQYISKT